MKFITTILCTLILIGASSSEVPDRKQTKLGLYITAKEAYEKWQANPNIKVLDVRTPGEYVFVGHAEMAYNIPLKFLAGVSEGELPLMRDNEHFLSEAQQLFSTTDTLLVMCRSGGRGAQAVNTLADAGYTRAFNIIDGFEGEALDMPDSYNDGKRILNGWKNSGASWTYDLNYDLVYSYPEAKKEEK